jgi:hypothetical protein
METAAGRSDGLAGTEFGSVSLTGKDHYSTLNASALLRKYIAGRRLLRVESPETVSYESSLEI